MITAVVGRLESYGVGHPPYQEPFMIPAPEGLSLTLCERVIIEEVTKNPTLVGSFLARKVERFPSEPVAFSVFIPLVGGSGTGTIVLAAVRLETEEQIYSQQGEVRFPDRFAVINVHFRVSKIRFPAPGSYAFMLLVDSDLIAQRRVEVYQPEGVS
jgi:hypothetical protein